MKRRRPFKIRKVQVLRILPNDILILTHPGKLPESHREHLRNSLERAFPKHKAVILEEGMSLKVGRVQL